MKHILLIGSWNEIIDKALMNGNIVSYFGDVKNIDKNILSKLYHIENINIEQCSTCLFFAKKLHKKSQIDLVISFSENGIESASIISEVLNIPGIELEALFLTKYKEEMRKRLSDNKELSIPWLQVKDETILKDFFELHKEIVIKPISGAGSCDVEIISDSDHLHRLIKQNFKLFGGNYIAEKFIEGDDIFSVESISQNGNHHIISLSHAKLSKKPSAFIQQIVMPPNVDNNIIEKIKTLTLKFLNEIYLTNGVMHTEIKVSNGTPYIIESQTRVGGDRIWRMTEITTNFLQVNKCINHLLYNNEHFDIKSTGKVVSFLAFVPYEGIVKEVSNLDFIKKLDYVLEFNFDIKIGLNITSIKDSTARLGNILVVADSHEQLNDRLSNICSKIYITYEDGHVWNPKVFEL